MALGPQMTAILKRYGLESLADWASNALIEGKSQDQILLEMYDQQAFKTRFAGMFAREAKGLNPISIDEYLSYENVAQSLGSTWGLNLSKQEVDDLIANDVSAQELESRFTIAATAVYEDAPETRSELTRLFGIGTENLMRYWMDPKRELGNLQQQYKMGQLAGAALRTGFGQITLSQAERLQQAGLTEDQAMQGFGQLETMSGLFDRIDANEEDFTIDEQLGLLTGNADAAKKAEERARKRKAEFEGAGGFAAGSEGFATGTAD